MVAGDGSIGFGYAQPLFFFFWSVMPNLLEMNFMGWFSSQFGGLEDIRT